LVILSETHWDQGFKRAINGETHQSVKRIRKQKNRKMRSIENEKELKLKAIRNYQITSRESRTEVA
jgi:hypothetical protein